MQQYEVTLKNEKRRHYHRIALFVVFINLAVFVFFSFTAYQRSQRIISIIGSVLLLAATLTDIYFPLVKNKQGFPYRVVAAGVILFTWWMLGQELIGFICGLLGLLYVAATRPLQVIFNPEGITYPAIVQKKINWADCLNVILKDGLLTIDLKNNHIIQQPVDDTKTTVIEKDFNDFCRERLKV